MRQLDRAKEEARRAESRAVKLQERLQDADHRAAQVGCCVTSEPVHTGGLGFRGRHELLHQALIGMLCEQSSTIHIVLSPSCWTWTAQTGPLQYRLMVNHAAAEKC